MNILGLTIYPYGLALSCAALLGIALAHQQMTRRGLAAGTCSLFALWCLPLSLLMARLVYCLVCIDGFAQRGVGYYFDFTGGGFTLWGAMLGGCLAALITAAQTKQSFAKLADAVAAPAALVIALGRLAEGLVGEGYGWYVEDWFDAEMGMSLFHPEEFDFFLRFPFAVQDMYGEWSWAVFVVEALLCLLICVLLLARKKEPDGTLALRSLSMLAAAQIFCESLRQDAVLRFGFVRFSQIFGAMLLLGILLFGIFQMPEKKPKTIGADALIFLACVAIVIAMEFALEKKIVFLEFMPMDVCYVLSASACLGLACLTGSLLSSNNPD